MNNLPTFWQCSSHHQGESEEVWTNSAIYSHALLRIHVIGGQRSVRIAPPSLPPHHSSPTTRDFQSSISVEVHLWGCHLHQSYPMSSVIVVTYFIFYHNPGWFLVASEAVPVHRLAGGRYTRQWWWAYWSHRTGAEMAEELRRQTHCGALQVSECNRVTSTCMCSLVTRSPVFTFRLCSQ